MTGRDLACRALYTDHPLCRLYALANGQWIDGVFYPAGEWSVRELIEFAESLPAPIVARLADERLRGAS